MKRILYCLSAALTAGLLLSCHQEDPEPQQENNIEILNGEISFQPDGGTEIIRVKASGAISAQADKDWCAVSVEGDDQVRVTAPSYDGIETRYAYVDIRCGDETVGVIIHQFGVIVRSFEASDLFLKNAPAEFTFEYDANATMCANANVDWIHTKVEGKTLSVTVDRNEGMQSRTGTVKWEIGAMTDSFNITQFDPAESGLLGEWTWNAVRVTDNSRLELAANLTEAGEGSYELTLQSDNMDFKFTDVRMDGIVLQIPLGQEIGTYRTSSSTYYAFCLLAPDTKAITYTNVNAVRTGYYTFDLHFDTENQTWTATARESEYPNKNFRFEYWKTSAHTGNSSSRTVLKSIVLNKQ